MNERDQPPAKAPEAPDLAELLRLHFQASRMELGQSLEEWAIKTMRNTVTLAASVVLAGIGGIFLLVAAALAIGDALDHVSWGLLIVGAALAAGGGGLALGRFILDKNRTNQGLV